MNNFFQLKKIKRTTAVAAIMALLLAQTAGMVSTVQAATLTGGSLSLSDPRPSEENVTYTFDWSGVTTGTEIKCIEAVFSDSATGGTKPTGMDTTGASLTSSTFITAGSWTGDFTTDGTLELTNDSGETAGNGDLVFGGITNSSVADTGYYAIFNTYSDTGCTTGVDEGTVMFINTEGQAVSMTVDPSLSFTIAGVADTATVNGTDLSVTTTSTEIPLGTVTTDANAVAAHDLTVGTNASNGYTVYIRYTGQPEYGTETITDHSGTNTSPTSFSAVGTEAFGYTTEDSTLGTGTADRFDANNWAAFTTENLEVAYNNGPVNDETTRIGYQVGIAADTAAGNYTTTVILTATPTY